MKTIEEALKITNKEEALAELKNHIKVRNQMGGAMWWNILNDECNQIADKCLELGATQKELREAIN